MRIVEQLSVFVGGSVGSNPYGPNTWSGSCSYFLRALNRAGVLDQALGIDLPRVSRTMVLLKNVRRNRSVWRKHFYFDPAYRNALTRAASKTKPGSAFLLQIGSMFSLPDAFPGRKCISYHDGSLAELQRSGFGLEGVSKRRIDQALQYERQISQRMTAIFTFSDYLRNSFIRDYDVSADRVFAVGAGTNLDTAVPVVENKSYNAQRILFIGKEFERKGGPQLLQAFQRLRQAMPNAELHIVGPVGLTGLPPGAISHGRLSKADPVQNAKFENLFREASLFVLPSLYEPFGVAPLEAMLYQLPCLVTNDWALCESVTPGLNGDLVEKGSVDDLAEKMRVLLSDPEALARMGAQARIRALEQYTWDAVASRVTSILSTL